MREYGIKDISDIAEVYCKCFEDNTGALELATVPKLRQRTKHIDIVYHHFQEHVRKKKVKIHRIDTKYQIANIFTKPLAHNLFVKHRMKLLGWEVFYRKF